MERNYVTVALCIPYYVTYGGGMNVSAEVAAMPAYFI